jgi:hypothetical protein
MTPTDEKLIALARAAATHPDFMPGTPGSVADLFDRLASRLEQALSTGPAHDAGLKVEGWRLVPEEPTEEMIEAGRERAIEYLASCEKAPDGRHIITPAEFVYAAMLAAAPAPPLATQSAQLARMAVPEITREHAARRIAAHIAPVHAPFLARLEPSEIGTLQLETYSVARAEIDMLFGDEDRAAARAISEMEK